MAPTRACPLLVCGPFVATCVAGRRRWAHVIIWCVVTARNLGRQAVRRSGGQAPRQVRKQGRFLVWQLCRRWQVWRCAVGGGGGDPVNHVWNKKMGGAPCGRDHHRCRQGSRWAGRQARYGWRHYLRGGRQAVRHARQVGREAGRHAGGQVGRQPCKACRQAGWHARTQSFLV